MNESLVNQIHWLGHDAFRIDAQRTIYIDPFQIQPGPKADIILVSHVHHDHCSPEDIEKIRTENTIIVTESDAAANLTGDISVLKPFETLTLGGIKIETVAAYNVDKPFHPQKNGWLGFIIETEGGRIYHSGDTDFIPEMKEIQTDIALLPVSGTYVMTAEEAVQAALAIQPGLAIPMHYGAIVGDASDAKRFEKALEDKVAVKVLKKL